MRPMTSPRLSSASAKTIPAAQRVARTIYTAVAELRNFPNRGRKGLAPNTRELVFPPWPFIVVYQVADTQLNVLRIRHASQDWRSHPGISTIYNVSTRRSELTTND